MQCFCKRFQSSLLYIFELIAVQNSITQRKPPKNITYPKIIPVHFIHNVNTIFDAGRNRFGAVVTHAGILRHAREYYVIEPMENGSYLVELLNLG